MKWCLLISMATITFMNRYAFFSPRFKLTIGPTLQSLLKYTAPAVLTALWAPIIFIRDSHLNIEINNAYFLAGLFAIVISALIKKPLPTVILAITSFVLLSILEQ